MYYLFYKNLRILIINPLIFQNTSKEEENVAEGKEESVLGENDVKIRTLLGAPFTKYENIIFVSDFKSLATCVREGCGRPRAQNPRTGDVHDHCSVKCYHLEKQGKRQKQGADIIRVL